MLLINPPDIPGLCRTTGRRAQPEVTSVEHSHPVNALLSYGDLHVEGVARRETPSWLKPIVSSGSDPLIWAGDDGHRRVVLIGFDLAQSDLPLKIEFPLLLANSISWLAGRDSPALLRVAKTGQPAIFPAASDAETVTTPSGETVTIDTNEGSGIFANTVRVGMYSASASPAFAVSLMNETESNTAPRDPISTRGSAAGPVAESLESNRRFTGVDCLDRGMVHIPPKAHDLEACDERLGQKDQISLQVERRVAGVGSQGQNAHGSSVGFETNGDRSR
jgi:hypothetical protein